LVRGGEGGVESRELSAKSKVLRVWGMDGDLRLKAITFLKLCFILIMAGKIRIKAVEIKEL